MNTIYSVMKPNNLKTRIFLDGGDPNETKEIIELLGFLDGQTTNPTLIAKNPDAKTKLERGEKFSQREVYDFYKKVVSEISPLVPDGSVSIEVYVDPSTPKEAICKQAKEMFTWIPNAHIKFPITEFGLACAGDAIQNGMRVNMTLCFSEAQAAAVHAATVGGKKGDVFLSPFIGRLDDIDQNGMDLIENALRLYKEQNSHVEVLAASIRTFDHFMKCLQLEVDIITAPAKILREWAEKGMPIPDASFEYKTEGLAAMEYETFDLVEPVERFDIKHDLTDKGIGKFASDWNNLIE